MGSAAARSLGERGVDTVLLEQFRVGHVRGSSHGAGRIFRFSYQEPDYVRLAIRAREVWRGLEERAGEELLIETGGIDSGPGAEECAVALEACGVPGEWWSAREAEDRFPGVSLEGQERVLWHPRTGVCLADRTVAAKLSLRELPMIAELELPLLLIGTQHVPQLRPLPHLVVAAPISILRPGFPPIISTISPKPS